MPGAAKSFCGGLACGSRWPSVWKNTCLGLGNAGEKMCPARPGVRLTCVEIWSPDKKTLWGTLG